MCDHHVEQVVRCIFKCNSNPLVSVNLVPVKLHLEAALRVVLDTGAEFLRVLERARVKRNKADGGVLRSHGRHSSVSVLLAGGTYVAHGAPVKT